MEKELSAAAPNGEVLPESLPEISSQLPVSIPSPTFEGSAKAAPEHTLPINTNGGTMQNEPSNSGKRVPLREISPNRVDGTNSDVRGNENTIEQRQSGEGQAGPTVNAALPTAEIVQNDIIYPETSESGLATDNTLSGNIKAATEGSVPTIKINGATVSDPIDNREEEADGNPNLEIVSPEGDGGENQVEDRVEAADNHLEVGNSKKRKNKKKPKSKRGLVRLSVTHRRHFTNTTVFLKECSDRFRRILCRRSFDASRV